MRGHWLSETRKLNRHYQSGEGGAAAMIIPMFPTAPGIWNPGVKGIKVQTGLEGLVNIQNSYGYNAAWIFGWWSKGGDAYPYNDPSSTDVTDRHDYLPYFSSRGDWGVPGSHYASSCPSPNIKTKAGEYFYVACTTKYWDGTAEKGNGLIVYKYRLPESLGNKQLTTVASGGLKILDNLARFYRVNQAEGIMDIINSFKGFAYDPLYLKSDGSDDPDEHVEAANPSNIQIGSGTNYRGEVFTMYATSHQTNVQDAPPLPGWRFIAHGYMLKEYKFLREVEIDLEGCNP